MIIIKEKDTIYVSYNVYQTVYTNLSLKTHRHPDNLMVSKMYHHPDTWLLVDDDIFVRDLFKHELILPEDVNVLSIQNEVVPQMKALLKYYQLKHRDPEKTLTGDYVIIHENKIYCISQYQHVKEIHNLHVLGHYDSIILMLLNLYKDVEIHERISKVYDFLTRAYHLYIPRFEVVKVSI